MSLSQVGIPIYKYRDAGRNMGVTRVARSVLHPQTLKKFSVYVCSGYIFWLFDEELTEIVRN